MKSVLTIDCEVDASGEDEEEVKREEREYRAIEPSLLDVNKAEQSSLATAQVNGNLCTFVDVE
jgi:hypothetical protein